MTCSTRFIESKRIRNAAALALVALAGLLAVTGAGPFAAFGGLIDADHGGTAAASDGELVISGGNSDYDVHATYLKNGTTAWTYTGHSNVVTGVSVGPNKTYVYSSSSDGTVKQLYYENGTEVWSTGSVDTPYAVSAGQKGELVFAGGLGETLWAFYTANGSTKWSNSPRFQTIQGIGSGGGYVAYGDNNGELAVLHTSNGTMNCYTTPHATVYDVAMGPNGTYSYTAGSESSGSNMSRVRTSDCAKMYETDNGNDAIGGGPNDDYAYGTSAVHASNGSAIWSPSLTLAGASASENGSIALYGDNSGQVHAYWAENGTKLWKANIHGGDTVVAGGGQHKPWTAPVVTPPESSSGYTQTFELVDHTDKFSDATLTVDEPNLDTISGSKVPSSSGQWQVVAETSFNHNNRAFVDLKDGTHYRLRVRDGDAAYQRAGVEGDPDRGIYTIEIGQNTTNASTATPTATPINTSDRPNVTVIPYDGGIRLTYDGEPVENFEYNLTGPDGSVYNVSRDFSEDTSWFQSDLEDSVAENASENSEDYLVDWYATTMDGEELGGNLSVGKNTGLTFGGSSTSSDGGGGIVPSDSGSGAPVLVTAVPPIAAIGYVLYRRQRGPVR